MGISPRGSWKGWQDWLIDFRHSGFVDLKILDFAAFSINGAVELSLNDTVSALFLPGLVRLFDKAKKQLEVQKQKWSETKKLSLSAVVPGATGEWIAKEQKVKFPYKRVGRINSLWSQAILGSFAAFHTRAALDHNFARKISNAIASETVEK